MMDFKCLGKVNQASQTDGQQDLFLQVYCLLLPIMNGQNYCFFREHTGHTEEFLIVFVGTLILIINMELAQVNRVCHKQSLQFGFVLVHVCRIFF